MQKVRLVKVYNTGYRPGIYFFVCAFASKRLPISVRGCEFASKRLPISVRGCEFASKRLPISVHAWL